MPQPYDRTTHDGKTVDWLTHAALLEAEIKLGYRLTVVQGSYHKGVSASAGTHDGGGCVDLAPWDHVRKVRVLRDLGWAIWHRPTLPGVWGEHIHGVLIGNAKVAPVAARQETAYRNRRDGLAGNRSDNTYHPTPIPTYRWPGSDGALALEKKAAALLDKPKTPAKPTPKPTAGGLRVDGIDLSHHNTVTQVGLNSAKNFGVKYAYLKSTEGTTVVDTTYPARRAMVRKADLLVGAYHFARPDADGKDGAAEAKAFLAHAKPKPGDMRPVLDLEDSGHLSTAALTRWVGDFAATVKAAVGCLPVVYTPFDLTDNFGCMLWVARYSNDNAAPHVPKPWTRWRMRQFSNGDFGKPNQIAGMHVDLNTLHDGEDLDWLRIPVKPAPEPTPKPPASDPHPAPTPQPEPTPAPVSGKLGDPLTLTVTVSNIKANPLMPQPDVESDIAAVAHSTGRGVKVNMGSEIDPQRYKDAWAAIMKKAGRATYALDHECPISLSRAHWRVTSAGTHRTHRGLLNVTPARYISVVRAESIETGRKVAFVATHFVSGAWSNKYPATKAWRRARWQTHYDLLKARVAVLLADGYTVVVGFDANRLWGDVPPLAAHQVTLAHHGIDQLYAIAAHGSTVTAGDSHESSGLHTDHPAITGTLTIGDSA